MAVLNVTSLIVFHDKLVNKSVSVIFAHFNVYLISILWNESRRFDEILTLPIRIDIIRVSSICVHQIKYYLYDQFAINAR